MQPINQNLSQNLIDPKIFVTDKSKENIATISSFSDKEIKQLAELIQNKQGIQSGKFSSKNRISKKESDNFLKIGGQIIAGGKILATTGQKIGSEGMCKHNFANIDLTTKTIVLKSVIPELEEEKIQKEVLIGQELEKSEFFVKIFDYIPIISKKEAHKFNVFFEYCHHGDLSQYYIESPENYKYLDHSNNQLEIINIIEDIAKGLCYLHQNNICHRDIKPPNIYLTQDKRAKIGDLGMAIKSYENPRLDFSGTLLYMSEPYLKANRKEIFQLSYYNKIIRSENLNAKYNRNIQNITIFQEKIEIIKNQLRVIKNYDSKTEILNRNLAIYKKKLEEEEIDKDKNECMLNKSRNLENKLKKIMIDPKNDIYSFGLTLFEIFYSLGLHTFNLNELVQTEEDLFKWHQTELRHLLSKLNDEIQTNKNPIKSGLLKIMCEALNPDTDKRPSAQDLLVMVQDLKNTWLSLLYKTL